MKKLTCILLALILLLSLTACGGSSKAEPQMLYAADMAAPEEAIEAPAAMAMGASNTTALKGSNGSSGTGSVPESRKWIITVDLSVETDDLETLLTALEEHLSQLEGYVEDQSIYNGSSYSTHRYRNANLTVRVPADRVEQFTSQVEGIANVVSNNLRREDVTLTYVATESKVNALKTEETRLLELLAEAETMSDLLEIEARLSDVRYELESYTTQLRTLTNQIDYATVYIFIEEVQEYTPVEEPTVWERITKGFAGSLKGLAEGAVDLMVWLITTSPYLVVFGVLFLVMLLLIKRARKINKKRKENT